jgi:hypothetical protein
VAKCGGHSTVILGFDPTIALNPRDATALIAVHSANARIKLKHAG